MSDGAHDAAPPPSRARWVAAALLILYGFAKLNGSQFTVLDSELTKPMGTVSGFWLTWYYFGYSAAYGTIIALIQIGGGVLLVFRRTALVGALLLVPAVVNIILVDIFFAIDPGATLVAIVILACLAAVIAPHVGRLHDVVLLETAPHTLAPRAALLALILAVAWGFTYWTANYNNRSPTAIDGVWSVLPSTGGELGPSRWHQVFFEHNRAYLVVLRAADGTDESHHFEVDEEGVVRIWQTWLTKGDLIMQGRRRANGDIEIGVVVGPGAGEHIVLRRDGAR